jgi:hypothetical protein
MNEAGEAGCQPRRAATSLPGFLAHFRPVMPNAEKESAIPERPTVPPAQPAEAPREVGGREGPEPTRFGDWELRGRCIDF